jgi:hypothetical protein
MLPVLEPMLAVAAAPFDSGEHCFEVKWDGGCNRPLAWFVVFMADRGMTSCLLPRICVLADQSRQALNGGAAWSE